MTDVHPRYSSIIGLGFGDCGKGLFADFFCRTFNVNTVVRFNGGAQAGHNVVLPDGRHHTFSQFGSGSFLPDVYTVLSSPVVVHPSALLVEYDCLRKQGVGDLLTRLLIDGRCRVITPFHQSAGRLRELRLGSFAHGSCGTGFGETVRHSLLFPHETLLYGELADSNKTLAKLECIRRRLLGEFEGTVVNAETAYDELSLLRNENVAKIWLDGVNPLLGMAPPAETGQIAERLHRYGAVFEGAQGMLLDEWKGFHPHTTWSSVGADALDLLAEEWGLPEPVFHFGVLRSYMTRHGNGPFPTEDSTLNVLIEHHNSSDGWQGNFRRGHPDSVLLQYALRNAGKLGGLLISHLDVFDNSFPLRWCNEYEVASGRIKSLSLPIGKNLNHQSALTKLLFSARPVYAGNDMVSSSDYIARLSEITNVPVMFGSSGNTFASVHSLS